MTPVDLEHDLENMNIEDLRKNIVKIDINEKKHSHQLPKRSFTLKKIEPE